MAKNCRKLLIDSHAFAARSTPRPEQASSLLAARRGRSWAPPSSYGRRRERRPRPLLASFLDGILQSWPLNGVLLHRRTPTQPSSRPGTACGGPGGPELVRLRDRPPALLLLHGARDAALNLHRPAEQAQRNSWWKSMAGANGENRPARGAAWSTARACL